MQKAVRHICPQNTVLEHLDISVSILQLFKTFLEVATCSTLQCNLWIHVEFCCSTDVTVSQPFLYAAEKGEHYMVW